jgi:thiaminase/transcriptional activator TenA
MPAQGVAATAPGTRRNAAPAAREVMAMGFCAEQLERHASLWRRMLTHPFLIATRDNTIAHETFARWMRQDYLFVEAAIPFIAALLPKAPRAHWQPLAGVITALEKELELFEGRARAVGVELRGTPPSFVTHAYIQFLLATALRASYAEAFTLLYAAEKAYHESWKVVRSGLDEASPWQPFVENWAGQAFADYVGWLEGELDRLAAAAAEAERERLAETFALTVRYEIAFWQMALTDESWPGLEE